MTSDDYWVFLTYLPTYPNQILYYTNIFSKIRCSLTYLPKNLTSYVNSPIVVVDNFTYHSEKSVISLPKSFNVFFTRLYSSTSMVVGMGLKPYFWPPKKTKLGPKDMSLQFWISSRQIP